MDNLHQATVQTFGDLLDQMTANTGIEVRRNSLMIVSGNTTMIHFLLKLDAWSAFSSPYAPVITDPGFFVGKGTGPGL